jgi:hypothetical protein
MRRSNIGSVALGLFFIALGAQGAGPKAGEGAAAEVKAQRADAKAEKAEARNETTRARTDAKGEKAEIKAEKREVKAEKTEPKGEAKAERAEAKADSKAERAAKAEHEDDDKARGERPGHPGMGRGHAHGRSAMRALHEELARGKIGKAQMKERLAELRASMKKRQTDHRKALAERYSGVLERPNVREELRHHARRAAFLNRALLVAQTELDAKKGAKTIERIEKLLEKEDARHERAMRRFETEGADSEERSPELQKAKGTDVNAPAKGTEP